MENEGKITATAVEALRSEVTKMSTKMAEEVVCMKNRQPVRYLDLHQAAAMWVTLHPGWCKHFRDSPN